MIVVMRKDCTKEQLRAVQRRIEGHGLKAHLSEGVERTVVGVLGQTYPELKGELEILPGVLEVVPITKPHKLSSREFKKEDSVVRVGDVAIGSDELVVMAGPCAVEDEQQLMSTARAVKAVGAKILRGGAFKPRSSPYSFRGMGVKGLQLLAKAREATGLPVVTEVMAPEDVGMVAQYADILQIGTRNAQNFNLLDAVGKIKKPVLLKRGFAATYEEWLLAAEYVLSGGKQPGDSLRAGDKDIRDGHSLHHGPIGDTHHQGAEPPPNNGRPEPQHRQGQPRAPDDSGCGRRRRSRNHSGRTSRSGGGEMRRRAGPHLRELRADDGPGQ